jgi:hypothetical protein
MLRRPALLLLLAPVGCFSASSGGGSPPGFDAAQNDAEFDSGTTPETSVDSSTLDVTVMEASVDAPVEAGPQPVTVVVTNAAGPEQGVPVVFQQATGAVIASATTNAAGIATQLQPAGVQVTIVLGTAAAPSLFTIEQVAPGDTLAVYDPSADVTNAQVSVDSWSDAGPSGTASYEVDVGSCSSFGSPPVVLFLGTSCAVRGQFPVLVTARDTNGAALGYAWQKGNTLPADGGVAHVAVSGAWSTTIDTQTVTTDSPPPFALANSDNGYLGFSAIANGMDTEGANTYFGGIGNNDGGVTSPFPYADGYPEHLQTEANITNYGTSGSNTGVSVSAIAIRGAGDAGSATTNLAISQLLPPIQTASIDSTTNPAQPTVTWDMGDAGSVATADGVVVAFTWSGNNDGGFVNGIWTIVAPPTATSVQVPALPAAQAGLAPFSGAFFSNEPAVLIVEASFLPGYAQLRAQAGTVALTSQFNSNLTFSSSSPIVVPPLPVDGTFRMTAFTGNGD